MYRFGRTKFLIVVATVIVVGVGVTFIITATRSPASTAKTNAAAAQRNSYAALYDAAWRQDTTDANTLVTATLFTPTMIALLGQDTGRSDTEEQIWRVLRDSTTLQIVFVVTLDSPGGAIPDAVITTGAQASATGVTLTGAEWKPLIAPNRVVNTNTHITSQFGLLVFSAAAPIAWKNLDETRLQLSLPKEKTPRMFSWQTSVLLGADTNQ